MSPCDTIRRLVGADGAEADQESRDGFCALAGRYCGHAGTYAGWSVTQTAQRCPGQALLGVLLLAAAAKATGGPKRAS